MAFAKILASAAIAAVAATSASAGNLSAPVADDTIVVIAEEDMMPAGSFGSLGSGGVIVPAVIGLAILAAAMNSGGGSDGNDNN